MADTQELTLEQQLQAEKDKNATLEQELATALQDKNTAEQDLADANQLLEDLNAQFEAQQKQAKAAAHVVTLGVGKNARKFEVLIPGFHFNGEVVKRENVKSNSEVLKQLVAAEAGVLREITAE